MDNTSSKEQEIEGKIEISKTVISLWNSVSETIVCTNMKLTS